MRPCIYFIVFSDHDWLQNLINEGFSSDHSKRASVDKPNIYHCGDVMYDNSLYFSNLSAKQSTIIKDLKIDNEPFILATVHRNDNTDDPIKINQLFYYVFECSKSQF